MPLKKIIMTIINIANTYQCSRSSVRYGYLVHPITNINSEVEIKLKLEVKS